MVCGCSWGRAEQLVKIYAKKKGIKILQHRTAAKNRAEYWRRKRKK